MLQVCDEFLNRSTAKSIRLFENGYHELQHDVEYDEMKEVVADWLQLRLDSAKNVGIVPFKSKVPFTRSSPRTQASRLRLRKSG